MYQQIRTLYGFATVLVAAIALSRVALAEPTGSSPDQDNVLIAIGNLLQIQVNGDDESITRTFSGQFRVSNDGSINYPTLGRVVVNGKSTAEAARMIDNPLHEQLRFSGTTSVAVTEYSPVFLLGSVPKAGPVPYQPGMTVFQLILSSGGLAQPGNGQGEPIAQQLPALESLRFSLEARKARIVAELSGRDFDDSSLPKTMADYDVNLVSNERAIFTVHSRAKNSQMIALEAQRRTSEEEISSLEQSIALQEKQKTLFQEDLQRQQDLSDKGFVPKSRLSELKREIIAMELQTLQFQTALYRAKHERLAIDQRFAEAKINEESRDLEAVRDLDVQLKDTDTKLKSAPVMVASTEGASMHNVFGRVPTYTLIRRKGASYTAVTVDETFKLEQGDILRVDFPAPQSSDSSGIQSEAAR